ncbi:C3a anaphylatoxin chemotactic receptor-like [Pristis pectinata]|uniref:C3a anaphylatoxin chemotactic receptor-like n=1 Tax=Pristis pectinata TaxID=685728 RepID=UPI00223D4450|nr:C3a anaphylatoxin chemotactic receptor-like [Pristis pectinata]
MATTLMNDYDFFSFSIPPYSSVGFDSEEKFSFLLVLYCLICLLGVSGNGLVLWIAIHEVRKTVSMIWVLNLSLADFTFTALLPFTIAHQALGLHWPFGSFMCKLLSFVSQLNMFASVFTLMVIALDRCISVTLPIWSQNHRTVKLAVGVSLVVWILAVVPSIPFFLIRKTMENEEGIIYCFYCEDRYSLSSLVLARFTLAFLMPFLTIAVCYWIITVKVRQKWRRSSVRSRRITCMIIWAFFICWLPFHVLYLVHATTNQQLVTILPLATCFAYANSCINPMLYMYAGRGSCIQIKKRIQIMLKLFHEEMSNSGSKSESRPSRAML